MGRWDNGFVDPPVGDDRSTVARPIALLVGAVLLLLATACSDLIDQTAGGPRLANDGLRTGPGDSVVVGRGLVVGGDGAITVHPAEGEPLPLSVEGNVVATFDDGAGGLVYITDNAAPTLTVHHLPAASNSSFTVVQDLGRVLDEGIFNGQLAVLAVNEPVGTPLGTLLAVQLDGTTQPLFQPPPTAVQVEFGGSRMLIGHVDSGLGCAWLEVVDLSGAPQEVLPEELPRQADCGSAEAQPQLPLASLADDGKRLAVAQPTAVPGQSQVRILDLDLATESLVVVDNLQRIDMDLTGGIAVTAEGVVELSAEGGQTWLTPFPPDSSGDDLLKRLRAELRLDPALVEGRPVATSSEAPPGAVPVQGETSLGPGSVGEAVSNWQLSLNRWLSVAETVGLPRIPVTGVYDPATAGLSDIFFQSTGRPVDGTVDQLDLEELERTVTAMEAGPGVIQEGARGRVVGTWQQDLAAWLDLAEPEGVTRGVSPDGIFGEGTAEVTAAFEQAVGNQVDGIVQPGDRVAMTQTLTELGAFGAPIPAPQVG